MSGRRGKLIGWMGGTFIAVLACAPKGNDPPPKAPASASPGEETQGVSTEGEVPLERLLSPEPEPPPIGSEGRTVGAQQASGLPLTRTHEEPQAGAGNRAAPGNASALPPLATAATTVGKRLHRGLTRGTGDEADRELSLGDAAYASSDFPRALGHYRKARRLLPKEPQPLVGISMARLGIAGIPMEFAGAPKEPRLPELKRLVQDALKFDSEFGPAHLQLGRLLLIEGAGEKASLSLRRAVTLLPEDPEAHSAMAVAALSQGDIASSVVGFERAAVLDPNQAERLTNLGTAYMMQGEAQRAITAYRSAVSLAPESPRARGDLGTALLATHNVKGALPHLERAHQLAPERATFMSNLGYAVQQQGDLAAAVGWYEKAIAKDPKLGSAWINLGIVRAEQGDYSAAEVALKQALKLDPSDPRAIANLEELKQARSSQTP